MWFLIRTGLKLPLAVKQERSRTNSTQRKAFAIRLKGLVKHVTEPERHGMLKTLLANIEDFNE